MKEKATRSAAVQNMLSGAVKSASFDNGLKVYVLPEHDAPVVSVQAWVATGSIHEGKDMGSGLSHFLEHMLFQGCEKYPGNEAADTVHKCGGDVNAYTSHGSTVYYISLPSAKFDTAADIVCSMISQPLFPKKKFISEKDVILREKSMYADKPDSVLTEKLLLEMFRVHPLRHPVIGYKDRIEKVTREMMAAYHANRYAPSRTFFVITGDVEATDAFRAIEERLGDWHAGLYEDPFIPEEPLQVAKRECETYFKDPLCRIAMGYRIPESFHKDIPALEILSIIAGENSSSRLVQKLKNEKQLAINTGSFCYNTYFSGVFGISSVCKPENREKLSSEIYREIESLAKNGVSAREFERTLSQHTADYIRGFRQISTTARIIGQSVLNYGSPDYADTYIRNLKNLKIEDVSEVAKKYLNPDSLTVITQLPEELKTTAVSSAVRKSAKPEINLDKTKNGIRLISLKNKRLPLTDVCMVMPGGVILENSEIAGTGRLLSAMLGTGTGSYSEKELAEILDDQSIDLNISGGSNTMTLRMNFMPDKLASAMDILKSILTEPLFGKTEFEREQKNSLSMIESRKMSPRHVAEDRLFSLMYGRHPYGNPACGSTESIKKMTADALKKYFNQICLCAPQTVFGISGDYDEELFNSKFKEIISSVKWNQESPAISAKPLFPAKELKDEIRIQGREQAVVCCAMPGCDNRNPDRDIIEILSADMNGLSSRLFKSIREDEGLAYYTGMMSTCGVHEGILGFYAGTRPDAADKVIDIIRKQLKKLASSGLTDEEFNSARDYVLFSLAEEFQNCGSTLFSAALSEFYGNGYRSILEKEKLLSSMKRDKVSQVVSRYLSAGIRATVKVLPATQD